MQDFYIKISRVGFVNSLILMMRKHQNVNQEKTYYKIHFNQNYSLQNVKSKHNKRAKET